MFEISQLDNGELSRDDVFAIVSLKNSVWPSKDKSLIELAEALTEAHRQYQASYPEATRPSLRHLAWDATQLVGHALTFERPIFSDGQRMTVMALSGVCVRADHRGRGIGKALVCDAMNRVNDREFPVSLFQTTVPEFYRKLGATVVRNRFFNSRNQANPDVNPWNDEWIMIYPDNYNWPKGTVDLNGPGY